MAVLGGGRRRGAMEARTVLPLHHPGPQKLPHQVKQDGNAHAPKPWAVGADHTRASSASASAPAARENIARGL